MGLDAVGGEGGEEGVVGIEVVGETVDQDKKSFGGGVWLGIVLEGWWRMTDVEV